MRTYVWLLALVDSVVVIQISLTGKAIATLVAPKGQPFHVRLSPEVWVTRSVTADETFTNLPRPGERRIHAQRGS